MTITLEIITKLYIINLSFQLCTSNVRYFPKKQFSLHISKGTPVQLGELPYMVALKARSHDDMLKYYTFCGGSLIGDSKILSAAHCFVGQTSGVFTLCYGNNYKEPLDDKYAVAANLRNYAIKNRAAAHEQWRAIHNVTYPAEYRFPNHDIAILFVKQSFKFNDYVKPIKYASKYMDYEGFCVASGYGRISYSATSDSLLKGNLILLSNFWCNWHHQRDMSHSICTSVAGSDIGKGDSGGPLVCSHTGDPLEKNSSRILVGIASGTFEAVALKSLYSRRMREYKTFCGACIVSPTKLITAAHCFQEQGSTCHKIFFPGTASEKILKNKYAVAGNLYNRARYTFDGPDGQWRGIRSVKYPKHYKFPKHDIAVAYLRSPFVYTSYISPIPIATRNTDYYGKCLVSGFGRTGQKKSDQSEILLLADLDIMPKRLCNSVHRKKMDRFVCTSSRLTDVGKGDSGGPLVCANTGDPNEKDKGVLVGIVSGHSKGRGSFFTRVSRYQNFVSKSTSLENTKYEYDVGIYTAIAISLLYRRFFLF